MTVTPKNLGEGQLPNSKGTLYTVPASTHAMVVSIILTNTNSSSETVSIYYKKSGSSSRELLDGLVIPAKGSSLGNTFILDAKITMEPGDILEGVSTTASKTTYVISGWEES